MILKVQKILKSPQHWISDKSSSKINMAVHMFPMLRSFTHSSRNTNTEAPIYSNGKDRLSSDQFNSWCLRWDFAFPNRFLCVFVLLLLPLTLSNHFFCVFALLLQRLTLKSALPRSSTCARVRQLGMIALSLITQGTLGWIRWQQAMMRCVYSMPWILGQQKYQISAGNLAIPHQLRFW